MKIGAINERCVSSHSVIIPIAPKTDSKPMNSSYLASYKATTPTKKNTLVFIAAIFFGISQSTNYFMSQH